MGTLKGGGRGFPCGGLNLIVHLVDDRSRHGQGLLQVPRQALGEALGALTRFVECDLVFAPDEGGHGREKHGDDGHRGHRQALARQNGV